MRYELEKWLKRKGIDYSVESGDKLYIEFYDFDIIVDCERDPYLLTTSIHDHNVDMDDQSWVADEQEFDSEMLDEMLNYIWYKKLESDDHKEMDEDDEDLEESRHPHGRMLKESYNDDICQVYFKGKGIEPKIVSNVTYDEACDIADALNDALDRLVKNTKGYLEGSFWVREDF